MTWFAQGERGGGNDDFDCGFLVKSWSMDKAQPWRPWWCIWSLWGTQITGGEETGQMVGVVDMHDSRQPMQAWLQMDDML